MKKKLTAFVLALCLVLVLAGCKQSAPYGEDAYEIITSLNHTKYRNMYYDSSTKIVYIVITQTAWSRGYGYMSPYYAPNGLPYLYDVESGELVEIER